MKHFTCLLVLVLSVVMSVSAQVSRGDVAAADYPFVLTTDPESPALYYIYTGRDGGGEPGGCVFTNEIPYGETLHKLVLMYKNPNEADPTQLWYFVAEGNGVKIVSAADGRMVTVANTTDGAKKVLMQTEADRTNDFYIWTLHESNGFYGFKTSDGKTFLSHNGNWSSAGPQMGLYNADGNADDGTRVFFEAYEGNLPTSISGALAEKPAQQGIFTLTGVRINQITKPGIYIVDGKKKVVK
jgi:hypothetical protein